MVIWSSHMSLRAVHREVTERKILDAALELVAGGERERFTIPAVSRRSGVSVPTIYRYFPTKDHLLDAAAWVPSAPAAALRPDRLLGDGFREYLAALWKGFSDNLALVRRQALSPAGRAMRAVRLDAGRRQLDAEQAELGIDPSSEAGRRLTSLCLLLGGSLAFLELLDRQGLSVEEAVDEVAWAGQVLLRATRSELGLTEEV